jgi:WD40 repeat protein
MRLVKLKSMKRINGLHYTPDGRRLLAVGGAEVRMQDWAVWIDVGEMTETLRIPMHAGCAAVSADCTRIAVGNSRPFLEPNTNIPPVVVFDATDPTWHEDESRWRTVISDMGYSHEVSGMAFDPAGKRLAVSIAITHLRSEPTHFSLLLLPLGDGKWFSVPPGEDAEATYSVIVFSPDGKRLVAAGGLDGGEEVAVVNARTADRVRHFTPPGPQTRHLLYSPDGRTLAVVNGKSVFLHPADSDDVKFTFTHPKQTDSLDVSRRTAANLGRRQRAARDELRLGDRANDRGGRFARRPDRRRRRAEGAGGGDRS